MLNLSIDQALDIWAELENAYQGTNGFGGETAEIYAYKLIPFSHAWTLPESAIFKKEFTELCQAAAQNLTALLRKFEKVRKVKITVEDDPYDATHDVEPFGHRVHVRVIHE